MEYSESFTSIRKTVADVSFGKMNQFITICKNVHVKDKDGFVETEDVVVAKVRAFKEDKRASEKWVNMATFSTATTLFRFRVIPNEEITSEMTIKWKEKSYQILSVENVRERGMYLEVMAEMLEGSQ